MNTKNIDTMLNIREVRRERANDRYFDKLDKAERMVGQLCREGETVYYVYPVGGHYRAGIHHDLIDFLIRNHYV